MSYLILHRPALEELSFRQALLGDEATMSYNHAWGGTIGFPRERWADWYRRWVEEPDKRFYRYLYDSEADAYVGETAYHFDEELDGYVCDVIVRAACRGRGYGGRGLELLCGAAKENGVDRLYDDIALDNPSVELFLRHGFREIKRTEEYILVARDLKKGEKLMENEIKRYCDKLQRHYMEDGKLVQYPQKKPMRILALVRIAERFEPGRLYTEKEVNGIIQSAIAFNDVEMVRRELFEYNFLGRRRDGSAYWVEESWRERYSEYLNEA